MNSLSCLYYPFSRCANPAALKQMLLVFDSLTFLDPVTDDEWRAHLLDDASLEHGGGLEGHREFHKSLRMLKRQGAVRLVDPSRLGDIAGEETALGALSDLLDPEWRRLAAKPGRFGLTSELSSEGKPAWQIFAPKLPPRFVEALREKGLRRHLLDEGDADSASMLSYEAGSAAALNVHLAAAEALSLAPVTDSALHHALYVRKLRRVRAAGAGGNVPAALKGRLALTLLDELLPRQALNDLTFEQILEFRKETSGARRALLAALERRLMIESGDDADGAERASARVLESLAAEVRDYSGRMSEVRTRLFASVIPALKKGALPAGLIAVSLAHAGVGPGQLLAGSIVSAALATLHSTLKLKAMRDRTAKSTSPAVAYLSRISELGS